MNGRIENDLKLEKQIMKVLDRNPQTVSDWYYVMKASGKSMSTCRDYVYKIDKFHKFLNSRGYYISMSSVSEYFSSLRMKRCKNGNLKETSDSFKVTNWCVLHSYLKFLYEDGVIERNFMESISKPKNRDLNRISLSRRILTKEETDLIIDSIDCNKKSCKFRNTRDKAILYIYRDTGMRRSALIQMNISDLDFENNEIRIIDKGHKEIVCLMTPNIKKSLVDWLKIRNNYEIDSDALFISLRNYQRIGAQTVNDLVAKRSFDVLGFYVHPHQFRGSFIYEIWKETGDIEISKEAVGHSSISTTSRYVTCDNREARKIAAEIMSKK